MHRMRASICPLFEAFRSHPPLDKEDRWLNSELLMPFRERRGGSADGRSAKVEAYDLDKMSQSLMRADSLGHLLRYEDRNAMAHSIEARVPFLDHRWWNSALGSATISKCLAEIPK